MDVQIKAKNLRLTDALQEYIQKRTEKLDKIDQKVVDAKFEVRSERNRSGGEQIIAQFTIATKDAILRTEEKNRDVHAAIDLAVQRMERQIRRFRDKRIFNRRRQQQLAAEAGTPAGLTLDGELLTEEAEEVPSELLVRRKRFKIQPMGTEEAIEQMELLGHDFFVFFDPDEAQINVLYRRRDGRYGVIQPELA